jgi:catechol 2,3-dioxygenase-like lactoylglutathione lyase family enzyme
MTGNAKTRITRVRTVVIPVADQESAWAFYTGTLGFEVVVDATFGQGQRWVEVAPQGAASTIALATATQARPAGVDTGIRFSTDDAAADHADLLARGVDADPELTRWPGVPPMFTLRDPDGNQLVIVEQPPAG